MPVAAVHPNSHGEQQYAAHSEPLSPMTPPATPGSSSVGWKSLLRLGNQSSKKLANGSSLTLDTNALSSEATSTTLTPLSPNPALSSSVLSIDQRSSYHSSLSTDSNSRPSKNSSSLRTPNTPSYFPGDLGDGGDTVRENDKTRSQSKSKSDKPRNGKSRVPLTANASQMSFSAQTPPSASRSGPLSPKAIGANATRFIRRVASAPNAKGLFTLGSRSASGATTKNGLLAPGDMMSPVPQAEHEASSLETVSSTSSRGRPARPLRANSSTSVLKTKDRVTNASASADGPGKIAFRRTYSSHSIKVRQVSRVLCVPSSDIILMDTVCSQVEVGPSSFQKIKMLGRGDVGKVYLVREKKSAKLFAMKGAFTIRYIIFCISDSHCSAFEEGDDRAEEDQAGIN